METETNEKKDGMETEKTKETNEIKIKEKEGTTGLTGDMKTIKINEIKDEINISNFINL